MLMNQWIIFFGYKQLTLTNLIRKKKKKKKYWEGCGKAHKIKEPDMERQLLLEWLNANSTGNVCAPPEGHRGGSTWQKGQVIAPGIPLTSGIGGHVSWFTVISKWPLVGERWSPRRKQSAIRKRKNECRADKKTRTIHSRLFSQKQSWCGAEQTGAQKSAFLLEMSLTSLSRRFLTLLMSARVSVSLLRLVFSQSWSHR